MGPRDSIRRAMMLRVRTKTLEEHQRQLEEAQSEYTVERETAPTKSNDQTEKLDDCDIATSEELWKMQETGTGLGTAIASPSSSYIRNSSQSTNGTYTQLLYQARILSESHLETLEATLDILTAMEGLSPHVEELKEQMLERHSWLHSKRVNLSRLEEIEMARQGHFEEVEKQERHHTKAE